MARKKKQEQESAAEPRRITPVDIQQKEFRMAMRGYNEQDVDRFLDEVTEEVARLYAENKRLLEEMEFTRTTRTDVGASAEADAILRRAREEADRLMAEARSAAGAGAPGRGGPGVAATSGSSSTLGPFISRERAFLQGLADLIQAHAEAVKQDLRRARAPEAPESAEAASSQPAASPEPSPPSEQGPDAPLPPDQPESIDAPTQAWMPPVSDTEAGEGEWSGRFRTRPDASTGTQGGPQMIERHEVVDLTETSHDPPETPAMAAPSQAELAIEDDDEDRSIRELFWGED
jgi:DivIVA domain-containing protein